MRQTTLHKLSPKAAQLAPDGWHGDGGGLFLRVKGPSRSWVFRWTAEGKKRERAIGPVSAITLAQARQRAADAREALAQGNAPDLRTSTPAPAPARPQVRTLGDVSREYIGQRRAIWSNKKHAGQWESSLNTHVPDLLKMPVANVTTADVADALAPIWLDKMETASRVRQRLERIIGSAIARGERSGPNPAALRDNLDLILPPQAKVRTVKHHAAVPWQDAPEAFRAVWTKRTAGIGYAALITCALTALRSGEVRHLQWGDIDAAATLIDIPADRMKARKAHRVPVSFPLALHLAEQPRWAGTGLIHPGQSQGRPMSDMTMAKAMTGAGLSDYTPHGWRSTFSDWANDQGWSRDLIEDQLAHTIGNAVERAYRRGDYLERRRPLMEAWGAYLASAL